MNKAGTIGTPYNVLGVQHTTCVLLLSHVRGHASAMVPHTIF